ncbi:F0F1 ATP synthase subunit gamma [Nitrolancea hollandica]|uniref:ATP synthase gamma chain n=1 Tax=Nitrolancea hollandica Lb TaxID=1129897 RepID=I4EEW4_9BACT|nr:F0F1 ATP synthase subunit gamma [Nitrolancea hollandica]CCF83226.1 ATP synthase F1, gamma subunit [Nitrolancea hollandica Lb]
MATPREIRRRIKSVKNISQITRAMQMVAASKMRRAQHHVLATRPYADRISAMIGDLASVAGWAELERQFPLLAKRPIRRTEVILVTPDKGLAGAMNTNVIRKAVQFMDGRPEGVQNIDVVAVGRKGRDFVARYGRNLTAEFTQLGDNASLESIRPVAQVAMSDFTSEKVDAVFLVYTRFINTLRQQPEVRQLLPVQAPEGSGEIIGYEFEPSPEAVLEALLPRFVEVQIYQALLENIASFYSAQMVAMQAATDNANELVTDLTLSFNRVRQAQITREVSEVAAGGAAIGA